MLTAWSGGSGGRVGGWWGWFIFYGAAVSKMEADTYRIWLILRTKSSTNNTHSRLLKNYHLKKIGPGVEHMTSRSINQTTHLGTVRSS